MAFLLGRSTRGGSGHCFQIGDDRVDLGALEVMLEGGHARRALADEAADDLIAAAGGVLGQEGAVGSRVDLRRQMANPAGLGENLPAQFLRGGQLVVGAGLLRRGTHRRQHAQENGRANGQANGRANRGAALHLGSSRHRFFASLRRRGVKRKARPRTRRLDRHAFQRGERPKRRLIKLVQGIGAGTLSTVAPARMRLGGSNNRSRWSAQMLPRLAFPCMAAMAVASSLSFAQAPSPNGVKTLNPPGAIKAEGTWSLGARAGDFVFVAGMQGVDPATNTLVQDPYARIRQAFLNIRLIAQSEGASLQDCVRLTVYVSDLHRFAPMVDKVQAELWSKPPYPPRTMIEVQRLFDDDIVEIDSIFYAPARR